jgi:hypothetical protein
MVMKELEIQDLPPSLKAEAFAVRQQILNSLEQSASQRAQRQEMQRKLLLKAKRRMRKQQKRQGHR